MTLVKICGLRDVATAVETAKAGADFIGLMFAESKRKVTPQECYDIVEALRELRRSEAIAAFDGPQPGEVRGSSWFGLWADAIEQAALRWRPLIVGVFADQPLSEVNQIAEAAGLDLVQLSGGEDWEFARRVVRPVIKAVHVDGSVSADDVREGIETGRAAVLMLDTKMDGARGGTGVAFDWSVAAEVGRTQPLMLAGGLTPGTVAGAVTQVEPWAVDVSSGVESDGTKDIEKIRAFIRAAKGAPVGG
ncbi:MAG TPA: phosphoribosylanthranilate isomerase [Tepidiformaceae bacterium]|nr:phosphoribosylanthranilate isomerase [Tepidiformaceae bacterium]